MAEHVTAAKITRTCESCGTIHTWTDHGSMYTSDLVYLVVADDGSRANLCNPCHQATR